MCKINGFQVTNNHFQHKFSVQLLVRISRISRRLNGSMFIVVPVIVAQIWRMKLLANGGQESLDTTLKMLHPVSLVALLATLVLLFGFQGEQITMATRGWYERGVNRAIID